MPSTFHPDPPRRPLISPMTRSRLFPSPSIRLSAATQAVKKTSESIEQWALRRTAHQDDALISRPEHCSARRPLHSPTDAHYGVRVEGFPHLVAAHNVCGCRAGIEGCFLSTYWAASYSRLERGHGEFLQYGLLRMMFRVGLVGLRLMV